MTSASALSVHQLRKGYGDSLVFDNLSFDLPAGETLSVIGPSGCGKSTLLYLLAGLDTPDKGTVDTGAQKTGKPTRHGGRVSFILQEYGLFPWKTIEDNLALPLVLHGVCAKERRQIVDAMLQELGLSGLEKRFPVQLSGGQRQRVAIGRALITDPDILLMDEPFSSLDALTREHLQTVVMDLWRRRRPTFVLVTHNIAEAVFLGGHIMVLNGHPARQCLWLDNPCFGKEDAREDDTAFRLAKQISAALSGKPSEAGR